jgi:AcrR family transcriptional regulator
VRSIATILSTATDLLASRPDVSMTEIARSAGVGRVTLYSHFPSRTELVDAVVTRVITEADEALAAAGLDDLPPEDAVRQLVATSWQVLDRFNRIRLAARPELGEGGLRERHDHAFAHVERLVTRGRQEGLFRADLPLPWVVTVFYALLHAAADEVVAGRVDAADVPDLLTDTILPMLRGPR